MRMMAGNAHSEIAPEVTVVVPVYNGEDFLLEALRSAQDQEDVNLEIVVVNDGSTDSSQAIAEAVAAEDQRVRVVNQRNAGLAEARNTGLRLAQSRYIALLDHDDAFLPGKLAAQVALLDENPDVAAVGTHGWRVGETGNVLGVFDVGPMSREHFARLRRSDELIYLLAASVLFRRDVALDLGGFRHQPDGGEDVDFWSRMGDDHVVLTLQERLVRYRVHSASMSTTKLFGLLRNTERLHVNVGRRRRGEPELSSDEYLELLKAQPFLQRLRRNLRWRSRYAYRVAGGLLANGNPMGVAWLGASLLLYPNVPLTRLRDQIVPMLRRPRRS